MNDEQHHFFQNNRLSTSIFLLFFFFFIPIAQATPTDCSKSTGEYIIKQLMDTGCQCSTPDQKNYKYFGTGIRCDGSLMENLSTTSAMHCNLTTVCDQCTSTVPSLEPNLGCPCGATNDYHCPCGKVSTTQSDCESNPTCEPFYETPNTDVRYCKINNLCGDCPFYLYFNGKGEICGDGVDNNNNGKTDEGCGGSGGGACVGKPIHLATGNMFLRHTDFNIQTASLPIMFTRTYNSNYHTMVEHRRSRLGYGWRHNYQSEVILPNENTNLTGPPTWYKVILGSRTLSFAKSGAVFTPQQGSGGYQFSEDSQFWELTLPNGTKYLYDKSNPAPPTQPNPQNPTVPDLNSYRQLVKIVAPNGQYLQLSYRTHDGVQFTYGKYWRSKYLASIYPYLKDGTSAGQGISFQYIPFEGNWRVKKIARTYLNAQTCSSSNLCSGTGEECIYTLPQMTHNGNNYGVDSQGRCGKRLVQMNYDEQTGSIGESTVGAIPKSGSRKLLDFRELGQSHLNQLLPTTGL